MLLKHRHPGIDSSTLARRAGFEHLEHHALAVLRWLNAGKIDYVLVGPVAHALRGDRTARGAVAIVPAPYGRNYERLARALTAERAWLRSDRTILGPTADAVPVKLSGEKLAGGRRWMFRFGDYDLDVEVAAGRGGAAGSGTGSSDAGAEGGASGPAEAVPRYQELLYETNRLEPVDGLWVEVASPEDLELFSHVRRTGSAPEFRVTRVAERVGGTTEPGSSEPASSEPGSDGSQTAADPPSEG